MESIKELREYAKFGAGFSENVEKMVMEIADEIEAEIERDYIKLPVAADGLSIHIGDNLHSCETGRDFPCRGYSLTLQGNKKRWSVECCYDSYSGTSEYVSAKSCYHVKIRELLNGGDMAMKISEYWNDDRTEREFVESGLQCCTRAMDYGHRCSYVALPKGHPLFGMDWNSVYDVAPNLEVDGGITFASGTADMWILGWDAAHAWHLPDVSIMSEQQRSIREKLGFDEVGLFGAKVMVDADMAEEETRNFAKQLAEIGGDA